MATYPVGPTRTYTTIQAAINAAAADLDPYIPVDAGTYTEALDLKKASGGRVVPVFIYAADALNPPVIAGLTAGQGVLANSAIATGATERPRFVNLIFDGWTLARVSYCFYTASTGPSIRVYFCTFRNGDAPVLQNLRGPNGPDRTVIYGCRFIDTGQPIHAENGTYGLVARNYFKPNANTLCVHNDRTGWYVYNNSAYVNNNGSFGVFRGFDITNNVIHAHTNNPWYAYNCTGTYDYNHLYGTTGANSGTNGGHNTSGSDPLFVNPSIGNLDIQTGSPCIDTGTTLTDAAQDIYNVTAPSGAAYDKGAHELVATTTVTSITVLSSTSIRLNLAASMGSDSSWATAANFTITPSGGAAAVTVSAAAASGNPGTYIDLTTTEHTNGGSYNVAWSGVTNVTSSNASYTGQGVAPTLTSGTFTDASTLRVVFAESMTNNAALTTASNYTLTPLSGTPFNPTAVTRIDATTVDLTLNQSLTKATGTLSVTGPTDLAGNACAGATTALTAWTTTIASVVARRVSSTYYVRVNLTAAVWRDPTTWVGANVTITGTVALTPTYDSVSGGPATWIDFTTGEQTNGASYSAALTGLIGVTNGSSGFTGVGLAPTVDSITVTDKNTIVVVWSEDMINEAALVAPANYTLTPGAGTDTISTTAVVRNSARQVTLTTTDQTAGRLYDISFAGPRDLAGNVAAVSTAAAVTGYATAPSAATAPSSTTVRVTFARAVASSAALLTPGNFTFAKVSPVAPLAPDLVATAVSLPTNPGTYVDVTVNAQGLGQVYRVTVATIQGITGGTADFTGVGQHNHVSFADGAPAAGKWGSGG